MNINLTIVTPVYNAEPYLDDCIKSVIAQNTDKIELILVNDGSIDSSASICEEYASKYSFIKYINQANLGPSAARNRGIEAATGDYITFLDADDMLASNYYSTVISSIKGRDLLFFSHKELHADGYELIYRLPEITVESRESVASSLLDLKLNPLKIEFCNFTWNKCFIRDIIVKHNIRFLEGLQTREDEVFTNEYCRYVKRLTVISDPLYSYRILFTGLTHKKHSFSQCALLVKGMLDSADWQTGNLRNFSVTRALNFYMEGASLKLFPPYKDYVNIHNYVRLNCQDIEVNIMKRLSFKLPLFFSVLFFYIISTLKYIKKEF